MFWVFKVHLGMKIIQLSIVRLMKGQACMSFFLLGKFHPKCLPSEAREAGLEPATL